jgi:hypothetical protein
MRFRQRLAKVPWLTIGLEMASIVFAVTLALAANEWRENRREKVQVRVVLEALVGELRANRQTLDERLAYYRQIAESLQTAVEEHGPGGSAGEVEIPGWSGLRPPILTSSAWEAAVATQAASKIDFSLAQVVARTYSFQSLYQTMIDGDVEILSQGEEPQIGQMLNLFRDLTVLGEELSSAYGQTAETLSKGPRKG